LEKVTKRVHEDKENLGPTGRMSHPDFHNGALPLSASAINPNDKSFTPGFKDTVTPKEMTIEDIKTTVKDFQHSAANAVKAGFDGVEIHSLMAICFSSSLTERLITERMSMVEVLTKPVYF
jgi:N-ethylmaleimide reductase